MYLNSMFPIGVIPNILLQNLFKPRHHPFFLEVMVLRVYIGVIEIGGEVYTFGKLIYLLTVFGVGILLINDSM